MAKTAQRQRIGSDKLKRALADDLAANVHVNHEAFFNELVRRVTALQQAGLKEKNIVRQDIKRVKRIKIGDKSYAPNEAFDKKNIVAGNVEDADEFTLGDGH